MFYARAVSELLLWSTAEFEEIGTEPDLLYVGLMAALSNYLLHCILLFAFLVFSQPY